MHAELDLNKHYRPKSIKICSALNNFSPIKQTKKKNPNGKKNVRSNRCQENKVHSNESKRDLTFIKHHNAQCHNAIDNF